MLRQLDRARSLLGKSGLRAKGSVSVCYVTHDDGGPARCRSTDAGRNSLSSEKNRSSEDPPCLPSQSQIIIAGAGTVANSVAYHLVLNGWNDVLVLEQNT